MSIRSRIILGVIASVGMPLALGGCFGNDEKDCFAEDQRGSVMPALQAFPIQVVADSRFSSYEYAQISGAVAEWNATTRAILGRSFFSLVSHDVPAEVRSANPNDCNKKVGSESSFFIVREESDSNWRAIGFNEQVPGATIRCHRGDEVEHQIVMINVNHVDQRQIQSVVLHELGHSIGLDHSCLGAGDRGDYRGCGAIGAGHPYHSAVMYPWLSVSTNNFGEPQTKTKLQENDRSRAACLYSPE